MTRQNRQWRVGRDLPINLMMAAILLVMSVPGSVWAVSLWNVEAHSLTEGELITLKFDEDLTLALSGSASQTLNLKSNNKFFLDAIVNSSELIQSMGMDAAGTTLSIQCQEPVHAELRRAGAGIYLLFVRATGQPAPPVSSRQDDATESDRTDDSEDPFDRANNLASHNQIEDAIVEAQTIPKNSPDYPWGQLLIGELEEGQGNQTAAEQHFTNALDEDETQVAAATNLALLYSKQGNSEKAETMWNLVLREGQQQVEPFDGGLTDAGPGSSSTTENSGIEFNSGEAVQFFNSTLLIIIALFIVVVGGAGIAFMYWRSKRQKSSPPEDEDEVFWGQEDGVEDDSGGLLAAAMDDQVEGKKKKSKRVSREEAVSEETRKRLVELKVQGNSIREMAEITGMSQDVIRMALQMEGVAIEV